MIYENFVTDICFSHRLSNISPLYSLNSTLYLIGKVFKHGCKRRPLSFGWTVLDRMFGLCTSGVLSALASSHGRGLEEWERGKWRDKEGEQEPRKEDAIKRVGHCTQWQASVWLIYHHSAPELFWSLCGYTCVVFFVSLTSPRPKHSYGATVCLFTCYLKGTTHNCPQHAYKQHRLSMIQF